MERRVAVICVHTSPLVQPGGRAAGGMNVYVREVCRELGRRGWQVDVFTRQQDAALPAVVPLGENSRVIHLPMGASADLDRADLLPYLPNFIENLLAYQRSHGLRYDLVHSHYWLSASAGDHLAGMWRVPHIVMFHTLGEVKLRAHRREQEPEERRRIEREIIARADRIIVGSQHEVTAQVELYRADRERLTVIPCGVDLQMFRPSDKAAARRQLGLNHERIILYVGRIEPLKGIDILIEAADQLAEDIPWHVVVVGGDRHAGPELRRLRRLARRLGVASRVTFAGAVEHPLLPLYYNAADVCVMPSYYESFGMVALESMACGTPVIASHVGGLANLVRDGQTGYLISWRCPEPFAERLEVLLSNDDLRERMGVAARAVAEEYSWARVTDGILAVYQELLGERATAGLAVSV